MKPTIWTTVDVGLTVRDLVNHARVLLQDAVDMDRDEAYRMDAKFNAYRANRAATVSDARLAYWRAQDAVVKARVHLEKLLAP